MKPSNFQTSPQVKGPSLNYKDGSNLSKYERRIEEEILRIFTDSDSFYYCPDNRGDITNAVPRQGGELDDRFFWNKHMLRDIIELGSDHAKAWTNPIIQGYVEIAPIKQLDLSLILISRRSRFRAGTRYKRRGLNPEGHCANYVETEQIISYKSHAVSFLLVRGSVPLYWSQPGIKYRPAPILHRSFAENQTAFEKHFDNQLSLYEKVIVVNLVEQLGKESIIFNAYTQHVLSLNNEQLVYVSFDFHEYCRGMHFERVSLLIDKLKAESIFRDMSYSWKDKQGLICEQKAVFRVNCIDCLDRTNVVQTALAKTVLIKQLKKLGIVSPEGDLPKEMASKFQVMWANNGDIISKQYAGTAALKGDFTRTGDRKLTGLMKDGMTSANRYYLSRFKDNTRQMCLDIMCGEIENTAEVAMSDEDDEDEDEEMNNSEEEDKSNVQHIKTLIEDCKRLMLTEDEHVINAWPLLAYEDQTIGLSSEDFDRILILTKDMLKIAEYNVHLDNMALLVCRHVHAICLGR
uniref:Phosphatidylinositide phosphatase SAC2 n=1 Tax=Cacopsylla melanoneura TaxID=428564 RepID=A0A8D8RUA9_9HEMI